MPGSPARAGTPRPPGSCPAGIRPWVAVSASSTSRSDTTVGLPAGRRRSRLGAARHHRTAWLLVGESETWCGRSRSCRLRPAGAGPCIVLPFRRRARRPIVCSANPPASRRTSAWKRDASGSRITTAFESVAAERLDRLMSGCASPALVVHEVRISADRRLGADGSGTRLSSLKTNVPPPAAMTSPSLSRLELSVELLPVQHHDDVRGARADCGVQAVHRQDEVAGHEIGRRSTASRRRRRCRRRSSPSRSSRVSEPNASQAIRPVA